MVGFRKRFKRQRRQRPRSVADSIPAPVTGWNTRDALDVMPNTDAVYLDNWFPTTGKVQMRRGYTEHAGPVNTPLYGADLEESQTGVSLEEVELGTPESVGDVETLGEYHAASTRKLLACAGGKIFDVTNNSFGSLATGFTSNRWQWRNFNGRMFFVNGEDAPQDFDGSAIAATAWSGTGLTIANLVGVNVHKSRLYFWEKDSQDFWYASPNAITGSLTKFPLSRVGQFGGNLVSMATWTTDGGAGPDDYAVFIMSSGEVIIYQGSDPGSSTDWSLVGVYQIGAPLDIRGVIKAGADLLVMTRDDFVSLSSVLATGQLGEASKLSGAIQEASTNSSLFGWQAILYKSGSMVLFNIPIGSSKFDQYVINATTGAACRFKDIPSRCWAIYNSGLFFGGDSKIYQYDTAWTDDGSAIAADGSGAWSSYGTPDRNRVAAVRPVIESQGDVTYGMGLGFDFNQAKLGTPAQTNSVEGGAWDEAEWDVTPWASELTTTFSWQVASGTGQSISPRMKVQGRQQLSWVRTDFRLEKGRAL